MAYNFFPAGYQPQTYPQAYPQQMNQPQMYQQNAPQNQSGIVWVQGIEGAKAHPVAAGQSVLLMDSDASCLYLKSADQTGMPTLRVFDYTERTNTPQKAQNADVTEFVKAGDLSHYVTKDDLKTAISSLKRELSKKKGEKVKDDE